MSLAARLQRALFRTPLYATITCLILIPWLPTKPIHDGNAVAGVILETAIPFGLCCWAMAALFALMDVFRVRKSEP